MVRALAFALVAALAAAPAAAQGAGAGERFSAIEVDVGPLRAQGLGPFAEAVREAVLLETRRTFADRMGRGPRLVVRVTGVSMNAYAGSGRSRGFGGSGSNNDYMEGEALLIGPGGVVVARHPQLAVSPASSGGAWYDPASEPRRLGALATLYAGWLRRAF